jgi:hypothetical protein
VKGHEHLDLKVNIKRLWTSRLVKTKRWNVITYGYIRLHTFWYSKNFNRLQKCLALPSYIKFIYIYIHTYTEENVIATLLLDPAIHNEIILWYDFIKLNIPLTRNVYHLKIREDLGFSLYSIFSKIYFLAFSSYLNSSCWLCWVEWYMVWPLNGISCVLSWHWFYDSSTNLLWSIPKIPDLKLWVPNYTIILSLLSSQFSKIHCLKNPLVYLFICLSVKRRTINIVPCYGNHAPLFRIKINMGIGDS